MPKPRLGKWLNLVEHSKIVKHYYFSLPWNADITEYMELNCDDSEIKNMVLKEVSEVFLAIKLPRGSIWHHIKNTNEIK